LKQGKLHRTPRKYRSSSFNKYSGFFLFCLCKTDAMLLCKEMLTV
jgi:hypothetical protein